MPRNTSTTIENNFVNGFITQGTALTFPKDACIDQSNCVFSERSIVTRRLGFDLEGNAVTSTQDRTNTAVATYLWKNASGDGLTNIVVQQNGTTLRFYNTSNTLSLSAGIYGTTVNISSFIASGATSDNLNQNECQFATGLGYLFVTHPYCDPFYVKLNSDGTFTASIINFTIRDVFGIVESALVNNRPSALSDIHRYNLINQGWNATQISTFHTAATTWPSNADVWWTFVDVNNLFNPSTMLASVSAGSSPAPQGFFRLNPWNTSRAAIASSQAGETLSLGSVDETSGTVRPSVVEFHAGRVWYAGVNSQGYSNRIYFSNVVQQPKDFGYCASVNDPTSQTLFDFVASDGGIISIPQAGTIFKMISLGSNLLVFGANGIWIISGSKGIGFAADDYSVAPVSYVRNISGTSYVVAEGSVYFWNQTDLNVLKQTDNGYAVNSLSYNTIKDFYIDLPNIAKKFARGAYNPRTHVIQWLYGANTTGTLTQNYTFNSVLCLNLLTGGFYTWTYDASNVTINSIVVLEGTSSSINPSNVTDNSANLVVDSLGNQVTSFGFSASVTTTTKYLVSWPVSSTWSVTFAEEFNPAYVDWSGVSVKPYTSFFTTGYAVKTQGIRRFQNPYIYIFSDLQETTDPTYTFQAQWDYGNVNTSGRFTQVQTVQHTETDRDAARRRLTVRGSGTACQFTFTSLSGKPFSIVGWSTYDTADSQA